MGFMNIRYRALLLLLIGVLAVSTAYGAENSPSAQTIWRLLDYIKVDYPAAVSAGHVASEVEYSEMVEFAGNVRTRVADLSPTPALNDLLSQADALKAAIMRKAPGGEVARIASALADGLLAAYPVSLAPSTPPDLARGQALYAQQCASCHGDTGRGDGPAAQALQPPPIDFTDKSRASARSLFGLYQVIGHGIPGTSMVGFDTLSPRDRWALAFYVGTRAYSQDEARSGERFWNEDRGLRTTFPSLESVTHTTARAMAARFGEKEAQDLTAFLRRNPGIAVSSNDNLLTTARARITQTWEAYQAGDHRRAADLALSAYLDGFEPVEPALSIKDAPLMRQIESAMVELRALIGVGASKTIVQAQLQVVSTLLDKAQSALVYEETDNGTSFIAAFTILLREGLEALLIVVAVVAFLRKSERQDVMRYVHAGWVTALVAGALTWVAANSLISISGASRELTEGMGAIFAAVVLVTVGIWMHGKSQAGMWQTYINEKMSHALSKQSLWVLFLLVFIVVYREVFETILFFIALWSQGEEFAILAGVGMAVAVLVGCAWGLLNYSKRLPIGQFFFLSSILMAVLAIVLAGKGIAALQEAGWIEISPVAWLPRVDIVGLHPTWEGVASQVLVLGVLLAAFGFTKGKA